MIVRQVFMLGGSHRMPPSSVKAMLAGVPARDRARSGAGNGYAPGDLSQTASPVRDNRPWVVWGKPVSTKAVDKGVDGDGVSSIW